MSESVSANPTPAQGAPNPFDLDALKIPAGELTDLEIDVVLTKIPIRKPHNQWYVMVHPDKEYHIPIALFEYEDGVSMDRETYIVTPNMYSAFEEESKFRRSILYTSMTRQGHLFLWNVPLPGKDGKLNDWHKSAMVAVSAAQKGWVRVKANKQAAGYDLGKPKGHIPDPEWPKLSPSDILKTASSGIIVSSPDHPVVRKLAGDI